MGNDEDTTGVALPASASNGPISHAIFRVQRLHRMRAGQLLRQVGLYPSQELVMMQLWDLGPQRQTDLVRLMDSDAATITRTVSRLEAAGFVRRSPSTEDRRVTIVEPTAASQALRTRVERTWSELESDVTHDLDAAERAQLLTLLTKLEASLARATRTPTGTA